MIVIGLGNKARHGKDTAASAILQHASKCLLPTLKMSWADALYDEVNEAIALNGGDVRSLLAVGAQELKHRTANTIGIKTSIPSWVTADPKAQVNERSPYGKHAKLLQWWGTEYRRAQDPDYWVKKGIAKIREFESKNPNGVVCVPDTRFFNEVEAIENLGGYTLNVTRLNVFGSPFADPGRDPGHRSETELDTYKWHFRIVIGEGQGALTGELAITIFEYIRGLRGL